MISKFWLETPCTQLTFICIRIASSHKLFAPTSAALSRLICNAWRVDCTAWFVCRAGRPTHAGIGRNEQRSALSGLALPKQSRGVKSHMACLYRYPVKEWQVSWFVLETITLNGKDTTVKRLDRNVKTFSADSSAMFANNGLCHSKLLSPKQTSWPATLVLETGTYLLTYLLTYLFTYLLAYFLTYLVTYLLTYLLTCSTYWKL